MLKKLKKREIIKYFLVFLLLAFCFTSIFQTITLGFVYAEDESYSNVLADLKKDENFNSEDYPEIENDYSLNFITLAESGDKKLFIYLYQPCTTKNIFATSINISTVTDSLNFKSYKLKFINSVGVFYKYLVEDFKVIEAGTRIYEISSIYRSFDEKLNDKKPEVGSIDEVAYKVARKYILEGFDENVQYFCDEVEEVTVTDKSVGFVRYDNGNFWAIGGSCDSHYIAFSTDRQIDKLKEADVYYVATPIAAEWKLSGRWHYFTSDPYGTAVEHYAYITDKDIFTNNPSWIGGKKYIRDRIETVAEFISKENLTDEAKQNLQGKEWILRFFESPYDCKGSIYYWTDVNSVTILRLKFEHDGVVYNLGVIDNRQTGGNEPSNVQKSIWDRFTNWLKAGVKNILIFVAIVIGIVVLGPFIIKGLIWLITAPFEIFKD